MKNATHPILFIHGAGGGGWEWEYWKRYYGADYFEFENVSHVGVLLGKRWKDIAKTVEAWLAKENI